MIIRLINTPMGGFSVTYFGSSPTGFFYSSNVDTKKPHKVRLFKLSFASLRKKGKRTKSY